MLTVGDMAATDSAPAGLARLCAHCHRPIVWSTTYLGRKLPFEPDPVARKLDYDGTGWIPGPFTVNGKVRRVFAPLILHPYDKRRRASHVVLLHACPHTVAA